MIVPNVLYTGCRVGFFPLPFYFPISSCLYQVSSAASQCFSPSGFPSCLSTEPGPCYQAGMEKGHLCSEMEKKNRGTTSRKPSSPPHNKNLTEGMFGPRSVVNPGLASQLRTSSPWAMRASCTANGLGGKNPTENPAFSPLSLHSREKKKNKKIVRAFFLISHFFYPNTFKVNFKKLGTLDSFN